MPTLQNRQAPRLLRQTLGARRGGGWHCPGAFPPRRALLRRPAAPPGRRDALAGLALPVRRLFRLRRLGSSLLRRHVIPFSRFHVFHVFRLTSTSASRSS